MAEGDDVFRSWKNGRDRICQINTNLTNCKKKKEELEKSLMKNLDEYTRLEYEIEKSANCANMCKVGLDVCRTCVVDDTSLLSKVFKVWGKKLIYRIHPDASTDKIQSMMRFASSNGIELLGY